MIKPAAIIAFTLLASFSISSAAPTPPATKPSVPDKLIKEIKDKLDPPTYAKTDDELIKKYISQLNDAIKLGEKIEQKYPDAPNLHDVRLQMLTIAQAIAQHIQDSPTLKQVQDIATRIRDSKAPVEVRFEADIVLLTDKISSMIAKDVRTELLMLVSRYMGTKAEVTAEITALNHATEQGLDNLAKDLADHLEKEHLDSPGIKMLLRQLGRSADVGKVFKADIVLIDGKKLSLPKSLAGKVVMIDFWASSAEDCIDFFPELRKINAKFKPKGLVILSISLDKADAKEQVVKLIADENLNWLHGFSGKALADPTALKYGIAVANYDLFDPCLWVIGRDGKVISDNALGDGSDVQALAKILEKAIQAKVEKPKPNKPKPKEME